MIIFLTPFTWYQLCILSMLSSQRKIWFCLLLQNWKIHFYFPPGKDGWRALIFEQREIIGEVIKPNKIVSGIEYTSSTSFHLFFLDIKKGQLVKMKFSWKWNYWYGWKRWLDFFLYSFLLQVFLSHSLKQLVLDTFAYRTSGSRNHLICTNFCFFVGLL